METGITLTGGGALIPGLAGELSVRTNVPTTVADEPLLAVARGAGEILASPSLLEQHASARRPTDEVVPIFTYRDERKLFALAGAIIVAALLALLQLDFIRSGRPSPLDRRCITTISAWAQLAAATVVNGTHDGFSRSSRRRELARENGELSRERVAQLEAREPRPDRELGARAGRSGAGARADATTRTGSPATVIGFDPGERAARDHDRPRREGSRASRRRRGRPASGVVGRVVEVDPLSAKVLLINDPTSRLPALVQRGRWWAIAVGTLTRVKLRFISQDAKLRVGDAVVTGEGRSFRAGVLIGRIAALEPMAAGALDQIRDRRNRPSTSAP